MKKLLLFITLCFITNCIYAQNEILIHSSGETMIFNTSDVDSVTFKSEQEKKMLIHKLNGEITEINRSEIDSIKFRPVQEEQPITLSASKTTITADGNDAVIFTVTQNNNDVTNECDIYVNGSKLNDNKYVTYAAGTYTAYAKKGDLKSEEISITAEQAPDLGKTIVFAEGVTPTSGWYDVNKVGKGETNGDINMCWAASSSNIIQWWQDRYVAAGNTLPNGAITGKKEGSKYDLELMDMFHDQWDNSRGADVAHAVAWYFEGRNIKKEMTSGSYAQPLEGNDGGYFKDVWNDILPHVYHEYDYVVVPGILEYNDLISNQYSNYDYWGSGSGLQGIDRLKKFSELVVEFMDRGMISLTIALNSSLGSLSHATTLWGYEIDNATGLITKIWITDSDDMTTEPKDPVLHEYSVGLNEGHGTIEFSGAPYGKCYAVSLYPVSGYGSR